MKKGILLVIFTLLSLGQVIAQSKPFKGYDQVAWGVSVENVRRAYNLGNDVVLQENYDNDPNIAIITQENVSDAILQRVFLFNKWKGEYQLYRVFVFYRDHSDNNISSITSVLENRYGRPTDFNTTTEPQFRLFTEKTTTFGRFAPDIEVELSQRIQNDAVVRREMLGLAMLGIDTSHLNFLRIGFTWKGFRDEYNASKLGL